MNYSYPNLIAGMKSLELIEINFLDHDMVACLLIGALCGPMGMNHSIRYELSR